MFVEVTDVVHRGLPGYVELYNAEKSQAPVRLALKDGKVLAEVSPGRYEAYIYVYDWDLPLLTDIQQIDVAPGDIANITFELIEGVASQTPLRTFDQDFDLALDSLELKAKTDPADPVSFPRAEPIPFDSPVLDKKAGWYKGDLHIRSVHGGGVESVADLVKRAEQTGLDFIAITDRNTLAACFDAGFQSSKVVLIPAMEWGDEKRGVGLIYGPSTVPQLTDNFKDDQGVCQRVQAQGGIFAVAHPCFPNAPWQRGLTFVNAVEVWCREWRGVPGINLDRLGDEYQRKVDGKLVYSISLAANATDHSANGQAAMFWDYELTRGLKAACIAGSMSASPNVPMGAPLTYVYAPEKSVRGILYGLRMGRTIVAADADAPWVTFSADAKTEQNSVSLTFDNAKEAPTKQVAVGQPDVSIGGVVPLGLPSDLVVEVKNAKGMKVEILRNGWPIVTKKIETDKVDVLKTTDTPTSYAVYRVRVIRAPSSKGFGSLDVAVMTSPIYAQDIVPIDMSKKNPMDVRIEIKNKSKPAKVSERVEQGGTTRVRFENGTPIQPVQPDPFDVPEEAQSKAPLKLKPL